MFLFFILFLMIHFINYKEIIIIDTIRDFLFSNIITAKKTQLVIFEQRWMIGTTCRFRSKLMKVRIIGWKTENRNFSIFFSPQKTQLP